MKVLLVFFIAVSTSLGDDLALQEFTYSNNLFSSSIYTKIGATAPNFLVCPLSLEIVLAMVHSGCRGETAEEIRTALHLSNNKNEVEKSIKSLLPSLTGNGFYTLHTADKMYVKNKYPIRPNFKKTAREVYRVHSENIIFSKKVKAAKTMNYWVARNTKNKIHDIVFPASLTKRTRVVLLNAVYFKADWSTPFPRASTRKEYFFKSVFESILVDMMHQNDAYFSYHESPELNTKFLELPFRGEEASMVIALPNDRTGLVSLENRMDKVLEPRDFNMEYVSVALPKFRVGTKINLKNSLKNLGVLKVFSEAHADLSGISGRKGDLVLDEILQKAFIDVGEGAVEAAAGSDADLYSVRSAAPAFAPIAPTPFVVDHPFIFYVKIKKIIVFVGRVRDPTL